MNLVLCTKEDELLPVDSLELTELEAQGVVVKTLQFFRSFLDDRPYSGFHLISARAENLLKRYHATTIADVKRLIVQSLSAQGLPGSGPSVRKEWEELVRASVH